MIEQMAHVAADRVRVIAPKGARVGPFREDFNQRPGLLEQREIVVDAGSGAGQQVGRVGVERRGITRMHGHLSRWRAAST